MKINRLRLYGWIGVQKGLGLQDLELDFRGLKGLIALSGKNGTSKTTVMESLQPYRTLASRKRSLSAHVTKRNSVKELDFDFQGNNYQTKVLIDCDSGKQEGYIWKNGDSEVDGKARNYDAYIENLFGSKDLFFNSIFCAQNSSKLSDLTTGRLKELFAEFLRLDQYIAYEKTTKQCIGLLGSQGTAYQTQLDSIRDRLTQYGDLQGKLTQARADLGSANEAHARAIRELVEIDADIAKIKEVIASNLAQNARLTDFNKRIADAEQAIQGEMGAYVDRVVSIRAEVRNVKQEIVKLSTVLKDKEWIERAMVRSKELAEKIEIKTNTISKELQDIAKLKDQVREVEDAVRREVTPYPNEAKILLLKEQIRGLKAQASDLEKRDPECVSSVCSFIETALSAERSLPALEKQLVEVVEARKAHDTKSIKIAEDLNVKKIALQVKEKEASKFVAGIQKLLTANKKEYAGASKLAGQEGDLREALARKEAAKKREKELTAQGMGLKGDCARKVEGLKAELLGFRNTYAKILSQIDTDADSRLERMDQGKLTAEKSKHDCETRITDYMAVFRSIENSITEKITLEKQLAEIEAKGSIIEAQVSEWTYLRNALSKDGIRALEIDSVAPSISAYANQILFNTFGPAYSVKLKTQDDEGREVLDILAIEEDGRETLLEDLSGGEKCWSLKALRLAMTLIAKQKSGRAFETAMADEEDGALDAENAQNFIRLYRSFMEAGGFESCLFISHRPECVAMADNVLEFGEGGININ